MFKELVIGAIKFYQGFISPHFGKVCRFYPSCSEYCLVMIKKYGLARGLKEGAKRILKCHPWNPGGVEMP